MVDDDALDQRLRAGAQPAGAGDRGNPRLQFNWDALPPRRRTAAGALLSRPRSDQHLLPVPAGPALARALVGSPDPARGGVRVAATLHRPVSLVDPVQPL